MNGHGVAAPGYLRPARLSASAFPPSSPRKRGSIRGSCAPHRARWVPAFAGKTEKAEAAVSQGCSREVLVRQSSGIDKPIGVAEYQLVRALPEPLDTSLPSIEQLKGVSDRILSMIAGMSQ